MVIVRSATVFVVLLATSAWAEPPVAYPRSFIDRPLILPSGMISLEVAGNYRRQTFEDTRLRLAGSTTEVGFGFGQAEIVLGSELLLYQNDNIPDYTIDEPTFQEAYASAALAVDAATYVRISGAVGGVASDARRYSPSLSIVHRTRTSENVALWTVGRGEYSYADTMTAGGQDYVAHRLGARGSATLRAQVAPDVAFSMGVTVAAFKYVDRFHAQDDTSISLSGHAGLAIAASDAMDIGAYTSVQSFDEILVLGAGVSITVRAGR